MSSFLGTEIGSDFCEEADGEIYGRCLRKPFLRYVWDADNSSFVRLPPFFVKRPLTTAREVVLVLRALTY